MPTKVQNARATAALVARYGIKGRFLPQLDEVIVPVHVVGSEDVSAIQPSGYQGSVFVAAGAGQQTYIQMIGTAETRILLDELRIRDTTGGQYEMRQTLVETVPAATFNLVGIDKSRLDGPPGAGNISGRRAVAVIGTVIGRYEHPGTEDLIIDLDGFEIGREAFLTVNCVTVNQAAGFTLTWRTIPNE